MPETAGTSANHSISTEHYGTRRRGRLPQPSHTLPGTDPPDDTLIQRCGRPHDQGLDIRVLCPPHANPSHGNARHSQVHPDISASLLDPSDGHEHSTPPPCPAQTGVCPLSRPTFTPQTTIVRVTQSSTASDPVAVIPPQSVSTIGGGRGYDDSIPGGITKTTPSGNRTTSSPHGRQACPEFN